MQEAITKTRMEQKAVTDFLNQYPDTASMDLRMAEYEILKLTYAYYDLHNAACPKDEKWKKPSDISLAQMAMLLNSRYVIRRIDQAAMSPYFSEDASHLQNADTLRLYYYNEREGIYCPAENFLPMQVVKINASFGKKKTEEVMYIIAHMAPITTPTMNPDLIPVGNGIFDYKNKKLLPFSPDHVYLTKCPVNYVPAAVSPIIHNDSDGTDWDIESWMASLSDDPSIVNLLWEITGACIRPGVRWDKAAWLYSTSGNSGKGTLCALMRNLCGENRYASMSVAQFDENPFLLESLIGISAVITDENDVGTYIDKSKNMKAAITGDVIQINRKHKAPMNYRFQGFIVQCMNELPKIRDRSESYARRQLIIPMTMCFTGKERKYIKNDYLKRQDVLEYALFKILNTNYYELSMPDPCDELLNEYKVLNNPVRDFAEQILPETKWDLLPFTFLYDLYKAWFKENNPSGTIQSARSFITELTDVLKSGNFGYSCADKGKLIRVATRMDSSEPLILQYNLHNWMNSFCKSNDPDKLCRPSNKALSYRGILRTVATPTAVGKEQK